MEAQALGEAVVAHLKHAIPGLIPITVKGSKQLRARDCMPVWQSKNVYIPKPDNGDYARVREYLQELLNFPNAAHDDQVDATTLALNQLHGPLFRKSNERMVETSDSQPEHSELVRITTSQGGFRRPHRIAIQFWSLISRFMGSCTSVASQQCP